MSRRASGKAFRVPPHWSPPRRPTARSSPRRSRRGAREVPGVVDSLAPPEPQRERGRRVAGAALAVRPHSGWRAAPRARARGRRCSSPAASAGCRGASGRRKYSRVMMASRRATYSSSSSTTGPARRRRARGGGASAAHPRRDGTRPRADARAPRPASSAEDMPRDARARCGRARCGRARARLAVLGRALDSSTFSAPAPFSPLRRARFLVFFARGTPGSASPQTKRRVKSRETPRLRSHEKAPPEIAPAADCFDATAQSVEMPRAAAPASLSR